MAIREGILDPQKERSATMELPMVAPSGDLTAEPTSVGTYLNHWGIFQRWIHAKCKQSRMFNTIVAALEMRLGKTVLLSLPQYLALCPTGQCNALCDFCSVTKARSGIIKKQLPFEKLEQIIKETRNTIRMYGLEGNGEPTLYDEFDRLVERITEGGATFYLITNGEKLRPEQVDLCLQRGIDAVNFSLNAATPETHRRVMKLKHFDTVIRNIRRFVANRTSMEKPHISVSMVVTRDNIHEVRDFVHFAEWDLQVDKVLVRPLSELGNDQGTVEDDRELVPYESEIRDMLDSVSEYLHDVPRRAEIFIDPSTFRAFRTDPADKVILPNGYEDRLLAPRRDGWITVQGATNTHWHLDTLHLHCASCKPGETLLKSVPIPVVPGQKLRFQAALQAGSSALRFGIITNNGQVLGRLEVQASVNASSASVDVSPGDAEQVILTIDAVDDHIDARIDFGRLHTPGPGLNTHFKLPHPRRWEIIFPEVDYQWQGSKLSLKWQGASSLYLMRSYRVPCLPRQTYQLPLHASVKSGVLSIGILQPCTNDWLRIQTYTEGEYDSTLDVETGNNLELQVVLFSGASEPLDVEIDWKSSLAAPPRHHDVVLPPKKVQAADGSQPAVIEQVVEAPPANAQTSGCAKAPWTLRRIACGVYRRVLFAADVARQLATFALLALAFVLASPVILTVLLILHLRTRNRTKGPIYCQKPWTDLHNFTVDGRMDVCCIATGASQEKYALGNMFTQSFQEIWNGPVMQEFRRTVNSDKPLPPCARCPMAFMYQGPLFSPAETIGWFKHWIGTLMPWPPLMHRAKAIVEFLVLRLLFRGFKA